MARIEFKNDQTRALEEAEGSNGRMNVDARAGGIPYHNAKHEGQTYSMTFEHLAGASGENCFYIKNTSTTKALVLESIGINCSAVSRIKLDVVTGTASGAGDVLPRNTNLASANDAVGVFKEDTGGAITGLTVDGRPLDFVQCNAGGHEEMRLNERVRLGQNDAIALELDFTATTSDIFGVVFFHYEG